MNRHDFIRYQHLLDEMEEEGKRKMKERQEGKSFVYPICSGAKGVRILSPDDEI